MSYSHGIYVSEATSSVVKSQTVQTSQIVIGTAPINMTADMQSKVNTIQVAKSFEEAVEKLGYSDDFKNYTLCQSIDLSFRINQVSPIIFINVLDPSKHRLSVADEKIVVEDKQAFIDIEGIILNTLKIKKDDDSNYTEDEDYVVTFNDDGTVIVAIVENGEMKDLSELIVSYDKLDPSKVEYTDIIGGYDIATKKKKGFELISQIYSETGITPSILIAPGWSHIPDVGAILMSKTARINGGYGLLGILDIDSKDITDYTIVSDWKMRNNYNDKNSIAVWPKRKLGNKTYYFSAVLGAELSKLDSETRYIPCNSPSNKASLIGSTILENGEEVFLDREQANRLNSEGVVTAIYRKGWKTWGNNTAVYPNDSQPESRWINVRRMFLWQGNRFIDTYSDILDNNYSDRLIEQVIQNEEIFYNNLRGQGLVAGMSIKVDDNLNDDDVISGTLKFKQYLSLYNPAETINNILIYDQQTLLDEILGGE